MSHTPEPERTLRSSVRNPRRRPRESNADSIKSAPRRKRSKVDANTFVPPRTQDDEEMDGSVHGSVEVASAASATAASPKRGRGRPRKDRGVSGVKTVFEHADEDKENRMLDGRTSVGEIDEDEGTGMDTEMPTQMVVRGGRKGTVKRPHRGDGATVLTQNVRYAVKLLPSTPRELKRDGLEHRGCLGAGHHALAVTRERAWIWDYTSHAPVNNARVFDVPFPVKKAERLPFGALVSHGGSSDMGMVLVNAMTSTIVFYDSVERAASLGLFQERNTGVEGNITGLFSGETITDLISADHAGFIIVLSSGRLVQLTLRDAQGKARVFTQYLRATEQGSSGIFGSIRGLLGAGAWKRDVAAVHTRPLGTRGHMQVLSLTERAELQVWGLDWSGQCTFQSTIDFRELIVRETKNAEPVEMHGLAENVTMLDFAIVDQASGNRMEVATLGTEQPLELLVLFKMGTDDRCSYMLAEVNLGGETTRFGRLLDLTSYHKPKSRAHGKPKLLLPKPQHTAIVAFEDAIVVTSIGQQEGDSPEAQFHASYIQPCTFEDAVFLRQNQGLAVTGASEEDSRGGQASSIAFVQGAGLVRLTAVDLEIAEKMSSLPVKSKMEQAVFYGTLQDNHILDFDKRADTHYAPDDVEGAALEISDEILRSTSSFISPSPTSMDAHLTYKAQALRALISHVRQNYPTLSKAAMWQLLWDAERVAAAQVLWQTFEEHVAAVSKKKRTATILDEVCGTLSKHYQNDDTRASDDAVRTFFVHHLSLIENLLVMTRQLIKGMDSDDQASEVTLRLVAEANDIWNKALERVFQFRADNAAAYGILPESIEDGILSDAAEYAELPEFWTSTKTMLKSIDDMCKVSRDFADNEWEKHDNDVEKAPLMEPLVQAICKENPRLVQSLCNIYQERIHWLSSRQSAKDREHAKKLQENYIAARADEFRALSSVAQTEAGLQLAEKYRDMRTLTRLVFGEMQFCLDSLASATDDVERNAILAQLEDMTARIGKYFQRFGDDWANAYFDEGFSGSKAGMMLRDAQEHWQDALSRYLRADPTRAKICWIDDVTSAKDYGHAGSRLAQSGREQESKLWNKKVELSMAKLALLATQEKLHGEEATMSERDFDRAVPTSDLAVIEIQERLYSNVLPEVMHCIDRQAELEVAMQKFVIKNQDLHALFSLLETCLGNVLEHKALDPVDLIDVLTLMDSNDDDSAGDNLEGSEFYLALQVLNAIVPSLKQDQFETVLQTIWKRCYVYDSEIWNNINTDSKRSSGETTVTLQRTAPWRTLELAMEDGFLDDPKCSVRFLKPSECLGAGCRAEDLSWRWPDQDLLEPILADNRTYDEQLQDLVASQRLDAWIQTCVDGVKDAVLERAEDNAAMLSAEREFEENFVEGKAVNGMNGAKVGAEFEDEDGSVDENGIEKSAEFGDEDEDEDVEMG